MARIKTLMFLICSYAIPVSAGEDQDDKASNWHFQIIEEKKPNVNIRIFVFLRVEHYSATT